MKLEFNSLNGLLHAALTYLCDEDCIIPGGANLPVGTRVTLEMSWPDAEQPIIVKGTSGGLDPAGRGLRLDIEDPGALHQIVMIMTHLHFGPKVGRQLLDLFNLETRSQDQLVTEPPLPAEALGTEPPAIADLPIDPELQESPEEDDGHRRTALPKPQRMSKTSGVPERPTGIRPPRLRPPVIRPPVIRPPAASTELPKFDASEEPHDLTRTAVAIDPQLLANLDDLDDDY